MSHLHKLMPDEQSRIQVLAAPAGAAHHHVAVFIEAHEAVVVRAEMSRLGGSRGVLDAVFSEPQETCRGTFVSHGFLSACTDDSPARKRELERSRPQRR